MTSPILEELKGAKKKIRTLETELSRVIADREIALARVAELEGVYEAEACPTCGISQVVLWETHQSIHRVAERPLGWETANDYDVAAGKWNEKKKAREREAE